MRKYIRRNVVNELKNEQKKYIAIHLPTETSNLKIIFSIHIYFLHTKLHFLTILISIR